ncbi:endonuclease III-like protein 1 isoform 1-T1 [Cochliomyia hominivorax]
MFVNLSKVSIRTMSSERKLKETLAKKLSGKKIPKATLQTKGEQAENKSQLFKEVKKNEKPNKTKEKVKLDKFENIETRSKTPKTEQIKSEIINNEIEVNKIKRTTRKLKREIEDEVTKPSLDVLKPISEKLPKVSIKKEIPIKKEKLSKSNGVKAEPEEQRPCSSKKIKQESTSDKWEPLNWQLMLENIRQMRANDKAPVDSMGCHKCADENADEKTQRFHKLVALMLSSQTKDETTYHAMLRLREHTLTPEVICNMKVNVLENILHPVSFYKNKAKYLQQTAKILIEKYNSDIPNNIKELVALPGVGPKMAHICMSTAWDQVTGIGVDVHVHRISNRIGWLPKSTKEPEQTRLALEAWLPSHLWSEVNYLLVGFGQTICTPVKPKCSECLNCDICPSASRVVKKDVIESNEEISKICDKVKFKKTKMNL